MKHRRPPAAPGARVLAAVSFLLHALLCALILAIADDLAGRLLALATDWLW